jgi:hypothetical protein
MTQSLDHTDLRDLWLWINRVTSDYAKAHPHRWDSRRHKKNLELIRQAIEGTSKGSAKDILRGLIAAGLIRYIAAGVIRYKKFNHESLKEVLPGTLMLDFAVDALLPIVIAPKLPESWFDSLAKLTSPQLASLVSGARATKTARIGTPKTSMDRQKFYSEVARVPFADGVLNLLDDLNNPRGGGSFLATVAIADGPGAPPKGSTPKALFRWLVEAAVGGVIGNKTDLFITHLWDWLTKNAASGGSSSTGGSCVTGTSDPGTSTVPANGASAPTGMPMPNASPAGAGGWARIIGTKGTAAAAAVGGVVVGGVVAIAGAGVGPQTSPFTIPGTGEMTVSQAPGAVAPSTTSASNMPSAVGPTTVNNYAPTLTGGATSPPSATRPPLTTSPTTGDPSATSDPPAVSAQPYGMTGKWLMKFVRGNGTIEHYSIVLNRFDDSKCVSVSPCYGGRWYSIDAQNEQAADFIVTASRSATGVIKISGTEVDYAQKGPQHYEGTAPNDTSPIEGTWSQDNQTATFTLTRQP